MVLSSLPLSFFVAFVVRYYLGPMQSHFSPSSYAGVRVAVLGASGFIGRWVARELTRRNADLVCIVRDPARAERLAQIYDIRAEILEADLADADQIRSSIERARPAITFNLAGYGVDPSERDEQTMQAINQDLVVALCQAISSLPASDWKSQSLVHVGSALEYGSAPGELKEDGPATPTNAYGRTKLAGTCAVADHAAKSGFRGISARLFTVYGPGEHAGRLVPSLVEAARTGNSVSLTTGGQQRDFCYVGDVAEGLLRLGVSNAAPGQVVNLATGRLTSVRGFALIAARALSIPADKLEFGAVPMQSSEMQHGPVAVERFRKVTGWELPTTIAEGAQRTWEFATSHAIIDDPAVNSPAITSDSTECFDAA